MKTIKTTIFICFLVLNVVRIFSQKNALVVGECMDNDVNNKVLYLLKVNGERTKLNNIQDVGSEPFFYHGLQFLYDENSGKMGCINEAGKWVIKPKFTRTLYTRFNDGIACLESDSSSIDLVKTTVNGVTTTVNHIYNKSGYIDTNGNWILKPIYKWATDFRGGIALVDLGSDNGTSDKKYINKSGKIVADHDDLDIIYSYNAKYALASTSTAEQKKYGLYSLGGKKWITNQIYNVGDVWCINIDQTIPLFAVNKDGKWGFIGSDGKIKIAFIYDMALPFTNGYAAVKKNNLWSFIDKTGKVKTDFKYKNIKPFLNGRAFVDGQFIDKNFKLLSFKFPKKYDFMVDEFCNWDLEWNESFIKVVNELGSYDIINWNGELIWEGNCEGEETCFPKESLVTLVDGSQKSIEKIQVGEEILTYNNGVKGSTKVLRIDKHDLIKNEIFEVTCLANSFLIASMSNDYKHKTVNLRVTGNHPVLTKNGIKKVRDLNQYDILMHYNIENNWFQEINIASITKTVKYSPTVYNLITESPFYVVNEIVVKKK